ncbi:MAG: hypothetical protein HYX38_02875 [Rhodospirillales bacterium]|nr:hypothetical protein [Rhodospirillales bacterium]
MRVFALGSCRVHDPLAAVPGDVDYLNRHVKSRTPIYLHDVHEMIQFLGLLAGTTSMPAGTAPFAFRDWRPGRAMPRLLGDAERLVIEVCTDKHYAAMGHTLNINEIHRQLVAPAGEAGEAWWNDVHRGQPAPNDVIEAVEAALRRSRALTETDRHMLREIRLVTLSSEAIAEGMARLRSMVACPILVVPHVAVRLADGRPLGERIEHIDKTIAAARQAGLAVLDPRRFVERDGQQRALADEGTDFHHYAADYLPVAGREIVRSLREQGAGQRV